MKLQTNNLFSSAPTKTFSLGPAATKVVVVALFAVLLLLYLAQSTQGATRQYEVRSLEDTLASAKQDREALQLESVRLQSLTAVAPPLPTPTASISQNPKATPTASPSPAPSLVPAQIIEAIPAQR